MNNEREMKDVLREGMPWTMSNCQVEAIHGNKKKSFKTDHDKDAFEEHSPSCTHMQNLICSKHFNSLFKFFFDRSLFFPM